MFDRAHCTAGQKDSTRQGRPLEASQGLPEAEEQGVLGPDVARFLQRIHDLRRLLNGEWVWDVFVALSSGPLHYTTLLDTIRRQTPRNRWPGKTHRYLRDSTLNRTLRRLEQSELVKRSRGSEFPYHATYRLTSAAGELLVVVGPIIEWAEVHSDLLGRTQQRRRDDISGDD